MMRRRTAAIGSAVMFIVGPGLVIGVVPWLLTGWQFRDPTPYWAIFRVLGVLLILAGLFVLIQAFARFVTEGFGTPLPAAPPRHLVVGGIYRWIRNPIYVAALAVILGQALLFGRLGPLVYATVLWAGMAGVVRWREEPILARRFGADYDVYRRAVRNPDELVAIPVPRAISRLASVTLDGCGSIGSAIWAAPQRSCAPLPPAPSGTSCPRRPR